MTRGSPAMWRVTLLLTIRRLAGDRVYPAVTIGGLASAATTAGDHPIHALRYE